MHPTTRLYLDVDGVINAELAHEKWDGLAGIGTAERYTIRWAPAMVEALAALPVELVWLTTWREAAPLSIAPLIGWGHEGRVLHPRSGRTTFPSIDWKLKALMAEQAASPSPFVWIDDELDVLHRTAATALGGLPLGPVHTYGITPAHLELIGLYLP